ncbi:2'-5' RNA ligase family protein [Rhizobium sp. L1K21]|uniref:2'-5' RNA ligase family protein n=1 Tax=Rhizobium sp. L1K21 TaxID=2954933 RepID=UPI002092CA76|nr:2'-5' RNA ligase family protein [Rhizobium sp. L1K21]MCO6187301.1 2'-5' RNA ligase family protein [Rhizobium sp. L1K21]
MAIAARLDDHLSKTIDRLRYDLLVRAPNAEKQLDYPPHITLAVIEDGARVDPIVQQLAAKCRNIGRLKIKTSHFGIFSGTPSYVFLAPVVTQSLLALHENIVEAAQGQEIHEHHLVGNWVPHITVATLKGKPEKALEAAMRNFDHHGGHLTAIELVRFPPVDIPASFPLQ